MKTKTNKQKGLIKKIFKEELPTMGNHLVAAAVATGAATGFSYLSKSFMESDAAISGIATGIDMASYWAAFLPQLMYRDRNEIKNEDGSFNKKKIVKKAVEYLSIVGIVEAIYAVSRFGAQYYLQKKGWEPEQAAFAIQLAATGIFTFLMPPIRYASKKIPGKN
ncbi:hypothetical protein ACFLZJ_00485 [Nanoarchaeota archaeon]